MIATSAYVRVDKTMAHTPGVGRFTPGGTGSRNDHGNLIGTNEVMTGGAGLPPVVSRRVFTAFGEPVYAEGETTRYGYAGQWGYQSAETSGDPLESLGWLHVGARTYDPAAGRFMQRDPIGIDGGLNVYAYCENNPVMCVDPDGESWWPNRGVIRYGPSRVGYDAVGKGVYRLPFRAGTRIHVYGLRGAACVGLPVAGAAAAGACAGIGINYAVKATTGTSLSDRIGNGIWDWIGGGPPGYRPY